jgi:hypothetical protein
MATLPANGASESKRLEKCPGLYIEGGMFMHEGKPFHGVGVNYFDGFQRVIGASGQGPCLENDTWRKGLRALAKNKIPFVRMPVNGFYPVDWALYRTRREVFFQKLDELVREAEALKIGIIPSFFWAYFTLPDLAREPLDQWGNPESKTRALMREFVGEVVERYKTSPAIWGWEFGNEYLIEADIPDEKMGRGWAAPRLGTPSERTARDKMRRDNVRAAYQAFGQAVRRIDKTRPIFTGDTMPRVSAWHLYHEKTWAKDSREQWLEMFNADNPDPVDTNTVHFYYYNTDPGKTNAPFVKQDVGLAGLPMRDMVGLLMKNSRDTGKPLFIGEFGTESDIKVGEQRRQEFFDVLDAMVVNRVQLAAFWVFDFSAQAMDSATPWNDNAYILDALKKANEKLQASAEGHSEN